MEAPTLRRTAQDHELHFGVNHLAHFLVQDGLVPQLRGVEGGRGGRVLACSSIANLLGDVSLDLTDLAGGLLCTSSRPTLRILLLFRA